MRHRAQPGTIIVPLGEVPNQTHETATATEASWLTRALPDSDCWACQRGVCVQRVIDHMVIHGRFGA